MGLNYIIQGNNMLISAIVIQNFRKLYRCHIDISKQTTLFVGANNSGKTSAMDALNKFLASRNFVYNDRLSIQVQHSYEKNFLSTSKGVRKFKRFLGRLFISSTMFCKSSSEMSAKEVPFGKNCRSRPLVFSFVPRCHGE